MKMDARTGMKKHLWPPTVQKAAEGYNFPRGLGLKVKWWKKSWNKNKNKKRLNIYKHQYIPVYTTLVHGKTFCAGIAQMFM